MFFTDICFCVNFWNNQIHVKWKTSQSGGWSLSWALVLTWWVTTTMSNHSLFTRYRVYQVLGTRYQAQRRFLHMYIRTNCTYCTYWTHWVYLYVLYVLYVPTVLKYVQTYLHTVNVIGWAQPGMQALARQICQIDQLGLTVYGFMLCAVVALCKHSWLIS